MRYFTSYLKKQYYYVTGFTCNALTPTLVTNMSVKNLFTTTWLTFHSKIKRKKKWFALTKY